MKNSIHIERLSSTLPRMLMTRARTGQQRVVESMSEELQKMTERSDRVKR